MVTAHEHADALPRVGSLLAPLRLPSAPTGAPVALRRWGREATVLIRLDAVDCAACRDYLRELDRHRADLALWDGRVVVVVPGTVEDATRLKAELGLGLIVAADPDGRSPLPAALAPAWLVADRYGQVYHAEAVGPAHGLPEPREVEEWLKFLATQCPE
ncbi:MAG: hypothetical protein IRZ00_06500 [Gemmatimonadetes bacterium]|nr:hypothetical protein [Gemmatimonadota bacterium]